MKIEKKISYWLNYEKSLTENVIQAGHEVQISVLKEWWHNEIFRRDVLILCDDKPCWYGRTIIPRKTFLLKKDEFSQLGNKPIGNVLYHNQNVHFIKRRFFTWRSHGGHKYQQQIDVNSHTPKWGRATTFRIDFSPLYLMELFLPEVSNLRRGYE